MWNTSLTRHRRVLGALQPDVEYALQVLKIALGESRFLKRTYVGELEDLHELKACSAWHPSVLLELAGSLYSTICA